MLTSSNTTKHRTTIAISSTIADMVADEMIAEDRTSMGNMAEVLIKEALRARGRKIE